MTVENKEIVESSSRPLRSQIKPLGPLGGPSSIRPGLFGLLHTSKGLLARSLSSVISIIIL